LSSSLASSQPLTSLKVRMDFSGSSSFLYSLGSVEEALAGEALWGREEKAVRWGRHVQHVQSTSRRAMRCGAEGGER
jgi:hypothetical protein